MSKSRLNITSGGGQSMAGDVNNQLEVTGAFLNPSDLTLQDTTSSEFTPNIVSPSTSPDSSSPRGGGGDSEEDKPECVGSSSSSGSVSNETFFLDTEEKLIHYLLPGVLEKLGTEEVVDPRFKEAAVRTLSHFVREGIEALAFGNASTALHEVEAQQDEINLKVEKPIVVLYYEKQHSKKTQSILLYCEEAARQGYFPQRMLHLSRTIMPREKWRYFGETERVLVNLKNAKIVAPICYGYDEALSGDNLIRMVDLFLKAGVSSIQLYLGEYNNVLLSKSQNEKEGSEHRSEWKAINADIIKKDPRIQVVEQLTASDYSNGDKAYKKAEEVYYRLMNDDILSKGKKKTREIVKNTVSYIFRKKGELVKRPISPQSLSGQTRNSLQLNIPLQQGVVAAVAIPNVSIPVASQNISPGKSVKDEKNSSTSLVLQNLSSSQRRVVDDGKVAFMQKAAVVSYNINPNGDLLADFAAALAFYDTRNGMRLFHHSENQMLANDVNASTASQVNVPGLLNSE